MAIRKKYGLIGTSNTEKIRLPVVQYGKIMYSFYYTAIILIQSKTPI
jgi:hypothetical protein